MNFQDRLRTVNQTESEHFEFIFHPRWAWMSLLTSFPCFSLTDSSTSTIFNVKCEADRTDSGSQRIWFVHSYSQIIGSIIWLKIHEISPVSVVKCAMERFFISPSHIINSTSSPESLCFHISLDRAGSDASCHGPADAPPPFLDRGSCLLLIIHTLCHTHWTCCNTVMLPSGHMTSIVLSIPERDPPLLLSWRCLPFCFPWKVFFLFSGSFSWYPMRGQRSGTSYVYRL